MNLKPLFVVPVIYLFCASAVWAQVTKDESGPALLSYDEIIQLYQQDVPPPWLSEKLNKLLTTPFVSNAAFRSGVRPLKPSSAKTGKVLRVAEWNIERGLEFDAIKLAFMSPEQFAGVMDERQSKARPEERSRLGPWTLVFQPGVVSRFRVLLCGPLRTSGTSALKETSNAERAEFAEARRELLNLRHYSARRQVGFLGESIQNGWSALRTVWAASEFLRRQNQISSARQRRK